MKILRRVTIPLQNGIKYSHSLLLKDLKPKRFVNNSVELTFKGPK